MKLYAIVVSLLAVGAWIGLGVLMHAGGLPGYSYLFIDAPLLLKMITLLLGPVVLLAALLTVIHLAAPKSGARAALIALSLAAPALGLLGLAFNGLNTWMAVQATHITNLPVLAPGLAEGVFPAALGLSIGAVCALVAVFRTAPKA